MEKQKVDSVKGSSREAKFVSSTGYEVTLRGIPPLTVQMISGTVNFPDPPTYTITNVAGDKEVYTHDESTLVTDEDKKLWEEYIAEKQRCDREMSGRMLECSLIESVVLPPDMDFSRWKSKMRLMGIPVSTDPEEMELQFKKTEIVRSQEDLAFVLVTSMALTGVSQEVIAKTKDSFRGDVEPDASAEQGNKAKRPKGK